MDAQKVHIGSDEAGVFGYGSLLSIASLERTLKQKYGRPLVAASVPGFRRTWDVRQPNRVYYCETASGRMYPENILYLNVTRDPQTILNGVVIVVTQAQLEDLDKREWIYDRIAVTDTLQDAEISGGQVYIYMSKPEFVIRDVLSPRIAAVRATYVDIVQTGLSNLGSSFRAAYERSTEPVPAHLIIPDMLDSSRLSPQ